jgi:hypothetical protein
MLENQKPEASEILEAPQIVAIFTDDTDEKAPSVCTWWYQWP